jgi:hypothetical protein
MFTFSRRSVFLDKHSLDPNGGLDSYRLTNEMGRRNRNQGQRQEVKAGTAAGKLQRKALDVKTLSKESRQGQMVILSIDRKPLSGLPRPHSK